MNITFLIGNGFDIGLGLETRYEDFYKKYCEIDGTENQNIKNFKEMLKNHNQQENGKIINWADFEKAFGAHAKDFASNEEQSYNEQKSRYIERFEDFVVEFNEYIEKEEHWLDYGNKELISKTMFEGVTTYHHIRRADRIALENLYNTISGNRIYNFISFNYTKSVDKCAAFLKERLKNDNSRGVGQILHIHGYIDENMIMGVNDPSQIMNHEFADDMDVLRTIVKPQQNIDVRSNYEKPVIDTINSSNIICIYGMSIGETDKKWWTIIAEWLSKSDKRALVILKYEKGYDRRFAFRQNQYIDSTINDFLKLSEQPEEIKKAIRSKIYVGFNHNVFAMNLRQTFTSHYGEILSVSDAIEVAASSTSLDEEAVETVESAKQLINK